ncbi:MAG: hypothetical protein ACK41D_10510 [Rubricoccaceae bacterium]
MALPSRNTPARSLLEVAAGFVGAVLIVPLLLRVLVGVVKGVFSLGVTKRLVGEAVFVGLTTLLTREDVLDRIFGKPGRKGDGLLKPPVD